MPSFANFLMSIPAILGAFLLTLDRGSVAVGLANPAPSLLGTAVSALVGVGALKAVVGLLRAASSILRVVLLGW